MTTHRLLTAGLALGLLLAGCATSPDVGVRKSYKKSRIEATSVLPFFTRSRFSLPRETLDTRLGWAESTAIQWLEERGIAVVPPERTRHQLQAGSSWNHFTEGGLLYANLAHSFEAARENQRRTNQAELVRNLHNDDHLQTRYLLFGELLYHTTGTCRTRADEFNRRAHVVITPNAPESMPRPCIVTHFQARLVDASSGETVWYNRRLRELHLADVNEQWIRKNLRGAVHETLAGSDGLLALLED